MHITQALLALTFALTTLAAPREVHRRSPHKGKAFSHRIKKISHSFPETSVPPNEIRLEFTPAKPQITVAVMGRNQTNSKPLVLNFKEGANFEYQMNSTIPLAPYQRVSLKVGKNVKNQALRCRILNFDNIPILVQPKKMEKMSPAQNAPIFNLFDPMDDSFGSGNWEWSYSSQRVMKVVCNPMIKEMGPEGKQVQVILTKKDGSNITSILDTLPEKDESLSMVDQIATLKDHFQLSPPDQGPFSSVGLKLGSLRIDINIRCQLVDTDGRVVMMQRGNASFLTFSDYGRGAWIFPEAKSKTLYPSAGATD